MVYYFIIVRKGCKIYFANNKMQKNNIHVYFSVKQKVA